MKTLAISLSLGLMLFGCTSSDGDEGGGTGGGGGAAGGGDGVDPVAPLAIECGLLGNDATFPFEFNVDLAGEPTIGQPVDATVTVSLVFSAELACGILAAGFTSVDVESGSDTVTITGVSDPDPGEVTVTLSGTPVTGLEFADGCGCADPGQGDLVAPCGTGPGLEFNFDPETVSVTPDGASTLDFLLTVEGVNLNLANLAGSVTIPELNIPEACSYGFIGADLNGDEEYNSLATPPLQIQIPVLCGGVDCNDDNDCTAHACIEGACSSTNVADDTPCDAGAGLCQAGTCVDRCDGVTCEDSGDECIDDVCNPIAWLRQNPASVDLCEEVPVEDGSSCDEGSGMCISGVCTNACSGVDCDDSNECTVDGECDPSTGECPAKENVPDDTECMDNTGTCQAGVCVLRCADAETRCDDGNDCTDTDCNPTSGACLFTPLTGTSCDVDGMQGTCNAGVCETGGLCQGVDCSDGNECTEDLCEPSDGSCSNPDLADGTPCSGGEGTCQVGQCVLEAVEFLAVDCELLGNSAALPVQAQVTAPDPGFAGQSVNVVIQDAIVLPADLVCGFIGAGFASAEVANSTIDASISNANITSSLLSSFLDDGTAGGASVSPHEDVTFDFGTACGDNCTGTPLTCDDGTTPCTLATFTEDCSEENGGGVGTGPGVVAPFLANAPGSIPPGTDPVALTPTAAGTVDFGLPYSGIAFNLPDVGGIASGCLGGACPPPDLCSDINRGGIASPRVMYDALCTKPDFSAGICSPFEDFANTADVCKGVALTPADLAAGDIPQCCDNQLPCVPPCNFLPSDLFCVTQPNVDSCCAAIATDYPTATAAEQPQLPVSAAP